MTKKIKNNKPFDGAISHFYQQDAPAEIKKKISQANKNKKQLINDDFPYAKKLNRKTYAADYEALQIELVKWQRWVKATGQRIAIVFEGRDAAGKGGTIKRFCENLNPRYARTVALAKPSDIEQTQWYFQRYIAHLPSAGEIVFFDRSWYNRAVVEKVFGFCSAVQRDHFFNQVPKFEDMLINDGVHLIKIWLSVSRVEQLQRFLDREKDIVKQWKLSPIDVKGLTKWDEYSAAIAENFAQTHTESSPWLVVRSDDKRRARLETIKSVLSQFAYTDKSSVIDFTHDQKIVGGPELID